jgi:serine/threonine protein kinase
MSQMNATSLDSIATGFCIDADDMDEYYTIIKDVVSTLQETTGYNCLHQFVEGLEKLGSGANSSVYKLPQPSGYHNTCVKEIDCSDVFENAIAEIYILHLVRECISILQMRDYYCDMDLKKTLIVTDMHKCDLGKCDISTIDIKVAESDLNVAVAHIHSCNILHLDIKPENILITEEGRTVLADFGSARISVNGIVESFGGTPQYMRPDTLRRWITIPLIRTHKDDLWSLAWTMLTIVLGRSLVTVGLREPDWSQKVQVLYTIDILTQIDEVLESDSIPDSIREQLTINY